MKNAISYYYNLTPNVIRQKDKTFRFTIDGVNYVLEPCDRVDEIEEIYELSYSLIRQGILTHQIILNNSNQIITVISDVPYVLIRILLSENHPVSYNDLVLFNSFNIANNNSKLRRDNWFDLWCNKIDYFEYQVNQLGKKYPLIRDSFSYYVGLAENGISLFKNTKKPELLTVSHRRIHHGDTLYELYNPLNLIIDLRIRDACEYYKSAFFNGNNVQAEIISYIKTTNLSIEEKILFFARMLFPTYYFDQYEKIMNNLIDEEEIKKITDLADDYEILLKNIYFQLKDGSFPEIEWISRLDIG